MRWDARLHSHIGPKEVAYGVLELCPKLRRESEIMRLCVPVYGVNSLDGKFRLPGTVLFVVQLSNART
jgi:hypothetical protein